MKNAIGLVTYKPNEVFLQFLNEFTKYDVYIIIDDNTVDYIGLKQKYTRLNIIQIDNEICYHTGFKNMNAITLNKPVTGWDKALYFFTNIETTYEYTWIFEDDVFFYNEDTLATIDAKYGNHDILCNSSFKEAKLDEWLWHRISIQFPPPYYCGMMCICRFSRKMLESIHAYADENDTLFYLEALFPCIAKYNQLVCYSNPPEFLTVTHRNQFDEKDFNKKNLYHPMKNMEGHLYLRKKL